MYKTKSIQIWTVFLMSTVAITISGCASNTQAVAPSSSSTIVENPTITPNIPSSPDVFSYTHFTPPPTSDIHLEFDYPSSWVIGEDFGPAITIMALSDPRFLTLPSPAPVDFHPTPNDFGSIDILIEPPSPGQNLDALAEKFIQSYSETYYVTPLNFSETRVEEYDAIVFEDQIDYPELYTSLMYQRSTIFIASGQVYRIILTIADKDRGGEFEKGYEYFFNSIKILP